MNWLWTFANYFITAESSKDVHQPELSCLYPSDAGVSDISSSNQFGRCYYWAAQLAGMTDLPKGQTFSGFVSDLVDRIQMRFENATLLNTHLATLTTKQLPVKFEYVGKCCRRFLSGFFLCKNQNFCQKLKFLSKINFFVISQNFIKKKQFFFKKSKFC